MKVRSLRLVCVVLACAALVEAATAAAGVPRILFSTGAKRAIPDADRGGGVLSKLNIGRVGRIRDIEVAIRINHSFVDDLNIYLVSPRGKFVELSTDNGGSGNNYGTGPNACRGGGSFTVFDDEAGRSIRGGAAPFPASSAPRRRCGRSTGTGSAAPGG